LPVQNRLLKMPKGIEALGCESHQITPEKRFMSIIANVNDLAKFIIPLRGTDASRKQAETPGIRTDSYDSKNESALDLWVVE
jgi:hypothetical protein